MIPVVSVTTSGAVSDCKVIRVTNFPCIMYCLLPVSTSEISHAPVQKQILPLPHNTTSELGHVARGCQTLKTTVSTAWCTPHKIIFTTYMATSGTSPTLSGFPCFWRTHRFPSNTSSIFPPACRYAYSLLHWSTDRAALFVSAVEHFHTLINLQVAVSPPVVFIILFHLRLWASWGDAASLTFDRRQWQHMNTLGDPLQRNHWGQNASGAPWSFYQCAWHLYAECRLMSQPQHDCCAQACRHGQPPPLHWGRVERQIRYRFNYGFPIRLAFVHIIWEGIWLLLWGLSAHKLHGFSHNIAISYHTDQFYSVVDALFLLHRRPFGGRSGSLHGRVFPPLVLSMGCSKHRLYPANCRVPISRQN